MQIQLVTSPALEPVTLSELRQHLGIDSGSVATDMTPYTAIPAGSQTVTTAYTLLGTAVEVLGRTAVVYLTPVNNKVVGTADIKIVECDILAGTYTDWATGAFTQVANNGMTTTPALAIGATTTKVANGAFTFYIGTTAYPKAAAETAPGSDTIPQNKYGAVAFDIDSAGTITPVSAAANTTTGYTSAVLAIAGIPAHAAAKARMGTVTAMNTAATFVFGTTPLSTGTVAYTSALNVTDSVIYEKAYTGSKRYIKTVARILESACEFGTSVMVWEPNVSDDDMLTELITAGRISVENDTSKKIMQQTWDYCLKSWPRGDRLKIPFGNLWCLLSLTIVDSSCVETDGTYALIFAGTNTTPATGTYTIASNVITAVTITGGGAGYTSAPTVATQSGDGSVTAALASVKWKDTAGTVTTLTAGTDYLVESNGDQCGFIVLPYGGSWPSGELYPSNPITVRFVTGWATAEVPVVFKQAVKRYCADNYTDKGDKTTGQTVIKSDTYDRMINLCGRLWDLDFL